MASTLDRVLQRAVARQWIPSADVEKVRARIGQLAAKYQFSVDDFATLSLIESYGLNPRADNGFCTGIIQFCRGQGAVTVGRSIEEIKQLPVLQQLDLVDRYFQGPPRVRQGADLVDLYLGVLYPAGVSIRDTNTPIPVPGQQARILYDSSGRITRSSIRAGLLRNASAKLGSPIGSPSAAPLPGDFTGSSTPSSTASSISGVPSVVVKRTNCDPPPPDQIERITYTGCENLHVVQSGGGGLGAGAAAPGVSGMGEGAVSLTNGKPYQGILPSGGFFAVPMKPGSFQVSSRFGPRWGRLHRGVDMAAPIGVPIYAAADAVITDVCLERQWGGCGGFGMVVYMRHSNGWTTIYAHLNSVSVRKGQQVRKQDQIGTCGTTGSSTGPHLHFETRRPDGRAIDPQTIIPIR